MKGRREENKTIFLASDGSKGKSLPHWIKKERRESIGQMSLTNYSKKLLLYPRKVIDTTAFQRERSPIVFRRKGL